MNALENIAISASAGSGKTYQLTNRFIYLLHLTEAPDRIIALTFTRTAAGEFFQKIVEKLGDCSESNEAAVSLSKELGIRADSARYQQLLQCLIRNMHLLNLQTLDSFFFRVVASFSMELGLSGSLQLLDESTEPRIRKQVRDSIVHQSGELTEALNEFWHAFKQATYGREERSIDSIVTNFIESLYALYLETPDKVRWGQAYIIWPSGCPWSKSKDTDWDTLASNLIASLPDTLSSSQLKDFETAADKVRSYAADEKTNTLIDRAFNQAAEIFNGRSTLQCGRGKNNQLEMEPAACQALADCLRAIMWHHLQRALENTQGVYRILDAYHENYDRIVRRSGKLAFADLTHLLSPKEDSDAPIDRTLLDYRLDAQFDHWLFDEFQDTSRPQWHVVANLIDEVVQDSSGQRSFFYVGDTKQCLYLWRNSDDRLFHDIQAHYNQVDTRIRPKPLSVSWRSAQPVLDAVNTLFNDPLSIEACFGTDAAIRWQRAWQSHQASSATKDLTGYACWLKAEAADSLDRNALILQILKDLDPIKRGMSVGVLVRKNAHANEVADYIREYSDFPVHTGSAIRPALDNAAGVALLSMLRLAAHPSDQQARGHLILIDHSTKGASLLEACKQLLLKLCTESSESAIRWACHQIIEHLPKEDQRHRTRLNDLVAIARAFDQESNRDIDSLYDFLSDASSGEYHGTDTIVVETIHKSKGLEYDVVLFACEDKTSQQENRIRPLLEADGSARWILEPIKKDLMSADPELSRLTDQSVSQNGFGRLCNQYVGMTRAKRALYMISDLERVHKCTTVDFLRTQLGDTSAPKVLFPDSEKKSAYPLLWETGDPNWHQSFQPESMPPTIEPDPKTPSHAFAPAHPRLHLARPSVDKASPFPAAGFFDLHSSATQFGTQVHDAFEQIAWWEDAINFEQIAAHDLDIVKLLENCFADPQIRADFTQPDAMTVVWRERAFTYVVGDQYVSGVFDRVTLRKAESGAFLSAEILDFKTDRIHPNNSIKAATEKHRTQLESYRKALATITGLPASAIKLKLLFTDLPALVTL